MYAGKPGPVRGATIKPPQPIELAAPLIDRQSRVVGHFNATLTGPALRWHVHVGSATTAALAFRIMLVSATGKPSAPSAELRAVRRAGRRASPC